MISPNKMGHIPSHSHRFWQKNIKNPPFPGEKLPISQGPPGGTSAASQSSNVSKMRKELLLAQPNRLNKDLSRGNVGIKSD